MEHVELSTRIPQPCQPDEGTFTDAQDAAGWQRHEINTSGCHVLAQVTGSHAKTLQRKLVVQLALDQVNLSEVGLSRVRLDPRPVLDLRARVAVALHSDACDQYGLVDVILGE